MSTWPNSDRPPVPEGARGGSAGPSQTGRGIVPLRSGAGRTPQALSSSAGLFFCALGGAVASSTLSVLAPALVAYGVISVAASSESAYRRIACVPASIVPAVALSLTTGVTALVGAVIACLVALAVGEAIVRTRLTPGFACVACALAALCQMGADAAFAAASGTTLSQSVTALLDAYQAQLGAQGSVFAAQMRAVRSVISVMWPTAYVVAALGLYLSALLGAGLATGKAKEGSVPRAPRLVDYDLPLWVVAVLVAGAAGLSFALTTEGAASRAALVVSANVVMALRFAFAAQGLAVLSWFVREKHVGPVATALAGALALYLEMQFVVLTVAGLVDVWANLRHLPRGAAPAETGSAQQD